MRSAILLRVVRALRFWSVSGQQVNVVESVAPEELNTESSTFSAIVFRFFFFFGGT